MFGSFLTGKPRLKSGKLQIEGGDMNLKYPYPLFRIDHPRILKTSNEAIDK